MEEVSILALGDSYTIGEGVHKSETYPFLLGERLKKNNKTVSVIDIIATTGWTSKDLISAIRTTPPGKKNYSFVFLLIGVNNQYQSKPLDNFKEEFKTLINFCLKFANNNTQNIYVLTIPDYSVTPHVKEKDKMRVRKEIDLFNQAIEEISKIFKINLVNITNLSRENASDDYLIEDKLHPSGKMYSLWANTLFNRIKDQF